MPAIGLVGAGGMAAVYAERIAEIEGAEISAVASPNSAPDFVAEHVPDATAYRSTEAMCDQAELDAAAILTPTHTHAEQVDIVAPHGIDILCEKPLARTMAEAEAIKSTVESADITFMTAHVVRFFPAYAEAKRLVTEGDIGDPGVARCRRAFGYQGERGWFDDQERSGGVLLDLAVHDFDYLRSVLGEVESVFTRHSEWSVDGRSEVSLTLLRFANGAVGHVEAWWIEVPSVPFSTAFEIAGDDGLLEYDVDEVRPITTYDQTDVHVPRDPVGDDVPFGEDPYRAQLEHFVDCVNGRDDPRISVEEGIASMAVSLAAIESAERGEPVTPEEVGS